MKNLNYIHYAIELRSEIINSENITDYDGSSIEIPCTPHQLSFKESHKLSLTRGVEYNFPPYGAADGYITNRKTTKSIRKQIEHNSRLSYFEMNEAWGKDSRTSDEIAADNGPYGYIS